MSALVLSLLDIDALLSHALRADVRCVPGANKLAILVDKLPIKLPMLSLQPRVSAKILLSAPEISAGQLRVRYKVASVSGVPLAGLFANRVLRWLRAEEKYGVRARGRQLSVDLELLRRRKLLPQRATLAEIVLPTPEKRALLVRFSIDPAAGSSPR